MISTKSEDGAKGEAYTTNRLFSKLTMLYSSLLKKMNYFIDLEYA